MKEIYSIWGIPSAPTYRNVESVITRLAREHGGPSFSPHITVVGDAGLPKSQLTDAIESLNTDSDKTFNLGRVAYSESYYKAVYIETRDDIATSKRNGWFVRFRFGSQKLSHLRLFQTQFLFV